MTLSIGKAWEEARAFIARERVLLLPVALLLIGVPLALIFQLIPASLRSMPQNMATNPPVLPAGNLFGILLGVLITIAGSLALYALALRPGISVGEAIQLGLRRMPISVAATLLMAFGLSIPLLAVELAVPALGRTLLGLAGVFLSVRLMLINAVIVERPVGPFRALVESWRLAKGHFWRLALFLVMIAVPAILAQVVAQMLFGTVGFVIGGAELGRGLADVAVALVMASVQLLTIVMVARFYRQVS
ncbi:hypothetical protein [Sphingobium subterraneum]|uniref:Glycerophosphoryl diester phosphodiesterase membrane domain-containing protein n=1 Tax=Sphingobium subterraneum TaxID=627688 RepID=A0A841IZK0_9SPHN|nr:hypothetical protein [Sphingobium subterraneum]MBB6123844.1 hypothetical protein [Sphingobium subterraneum]